MKCKAVLCVCVVGAAIVAWMAGCAGPTLKMYSGSVADPSQLALIRSGTHTLIDGVDDVRVKSPYLNAVVAPGSHILTIQFAGHAVGDKYFYATQDTSLPVVVQAGRSYVVNSMEVPESTWAKVIVWAYGWVAYVTDEQTGERVAESDPLPLRVEHIPLPTFRFPAP